MMTIKQQLKGFKTLLAQLNKINRENKRDNKDNNLFLCNIVELNSKIFPKNFSYYLTQELLKIGTEYKELFFEKTTYVENEYYDLYNDFSEFVNEGMNGIWNYNNYFERKIFLKTVINQLEKQTYVTK